MDNITFLQLIMSDGVFTLELLALFAVGFYLILAIMAYPTSIASKRGISRRCVSFSRLSSDRLVTLESVPTFLKIGFRLGTVNGVGAVVSPPRTWLRQDTNCRR